MSTSFAILKDKHRVCRDDFSETHSIRIHRALSWLDRAERADDDDGVFIFTWIAFNAAYGHLDAESSEHRTWKRFFEKIIRLDQDNRIYHAIWTQFKGPIRVLLDNVFAFQPFWNHHVGLAGHENWEQHFEASRRNILGALRTQDTQKILSEIFGRLYTLRNQLIHGGATWNGAVNRSQVGDGAKIMAFLVPIFLDVMLSNPQEDWGQLMYPMIKDSSLPQTGWKG